MARYSFGIPPTLSLTLASALWAVPTAISKDLLVSVSPITLLVIQLTPSVVVLWFLVLAKGIPPVRLRVLLSLASIGWLNPGISYTLSMLGLTRTTASVTTLLWAAEPALIVAMAWVMLREAITARLLAVTATAACGVLLVSGLVGKSDPMAGGGYGAALILGGVLCCALYTVLSRRIASTIDPLFTVAVQQTVALAWAVAIWPLELQGGAADHLLAVSARSFFGGAITGLMYYAAAFWFYLNGLRSVPASTASIFLNLIPVFGIATAYVYLGERLTGSQWIGAATILLSVLVLLAWNGPPKVHVSVE